MKPGRILLVLFVLISAFLAPKSDSVAKGCRVCKGPDIKCVVASARCMLSNNKAAKAIEIIKSGLVKNPGNPVLSGLLAKAYLADKNPFWAEKTLRRFLQGHPEDCKARAALAWVFVKQGDMEPARGELEPDECRATSADRTRFALIRAFIARASGRNWDKYYSAAMRQEKLYPGDLAFLHYLRNQKEPAYMKPLSLRLELDGGYTTNAMAGSPTDPGWSQGSSLLGKVNLLGRFVFPLAGWFKPSLELGLKGNGVLNSKYRDFSYLDPYVRAGFYLFAGYPRLYLAYAGDLLILARERDKGRYFYEGHRLELELDTKTTTIFSGFGRRIFDEAGRTRWELDGGIGKIVQSGDVRIMAAAALRYHDTTGGVYDLAGGTVMLVSSVDVWRGLYLRLGLTTGLDYYFNSGGEKAALVFGTDEKRKDFLTKVSIGLFSPRFAGTRVGVSYEMSYRDSTADNQKADFDYLENRIMAVMKWDLSADPFEPAVVQTGLKNMDYMPIDYGISTTRPGMEEERIQDMLRRDEEARRGSSCVE